MLTGFSRDRERICWYVVNGWDGLQFLPFTAGAVFFEEKRNMSQVRCVTCGKEVSMQDTIEIRWHGRGGQGAKTAALLLADVAFKTGKYVQGFILC